MRISLVLYCLKNNVGLPEALGALKEIKKYFEDRFVNREISPKGGSQATTVFDINALFDRYAPADFLNPVRKDNRMTPAFDRLRWYISLDEVFNDSKFIDLYQEYLKRQKNSSPKIGDIIRYYRESYGVTREQLGILLANAEDEIGHIHLRRIQNKAINRKPGKSHKPEYIENIEYGRVNIDSQRLMLILGILGVEDEEIAKVVYWYNEVKTGLSISRAGSFLDLAVAAVARTGLTIRQFHQELIAANSTEVLMPNEKSFRRMLSGENEFRQDLLRPFLTVLRENGVYEEFRDRYMQVKKDHYQNLAQKLEEIDNFPDFVFTIRTYMKISTTRFAHILGLQQKAAVSGWESGKRVPTNSTIDKIARIGQLSEPLHTKIHELAQQQREMIAENRNFQFTRPHQKFPGPTIPYSAAR